MSDIELADDDPRHGTDNGYRNLGCRCARCREAHHIEQNDWMHRHPEQQEKKRQRRRNEYNAQRKAKLA